MTVTDRPSTERELAPTELPAAEKAHQWAESRPQVPRGAARAEHHRSDGGHQRGQPAAAGDVRYARGFADRLRVHDRPPDPGPNPKLFEANITVDVDRFAQPYAAFATNFFDVDDDPGFLFVPSSQAGFRHQLPNRYLVYSE